MKRNKVTSIYENKTRIHNASDEFAKKVRHPFPITSPLKKKTVKDAHIANISERGTVRTQKAIISKRHILITPSKKPLSAKGDLGIIMQLSAPLS